ncbi:MAG TPA: PorV/PorQ family protein [Bacteroidota bacterium]|nr:PorV/PorQ family protein [Bacteroidota bacterium]
MIGPRTLYRIVLLGCYVGLIVCILSTEITYAQLIPNLGGQRAGISAFQFLKIGVGARGVALGETYTAIANDVSALYWNPAGLTQFTENQFMVSHTEYIVDINHDFLGAVYHLTANDAVGFSVSTLSVDEMEITTEAQPFGTGRYFRFGDFSSGLTYSKRMTDQFSFGVTLRYVEETLDILKMRGFMVDIGTFYWTGIGSTRFAVVVTNFGADVSPTGELIQYNGNRVNSFQSFSPPTLFKIGFALEALETESQRVTTSIELNHPNDNAENIHMGVEYQWEKWLWLRTGVKRTIGESLLGRDNTSANDITFGVGIAAPLALTKINLDYAFANFNLLGSVHRLSLTLSY